MGRPFLLKRSHDSWGTTPLDRGTSSLPFGLSLFCPSLPTFPTFLYLSFRRPGQTDGRTLFSPATRSSSMLFPPFLYLSLPFFSFTCLPSPQMGRRTEIGPFSFFRYTVSILRPSVHAFRSKWPFWVDSRSSKAPFANRNWPRFARLGLERQLSGRQMHGGQVPGGQMPWGQIPGW